MQTTETGSEKNFKNVVYRIYRHAANCPINNDIVLIIIIIIIFKIIIIIII